MQGREREVLELPLDRVDAEPMGERREDLERLLRLLVLLGLGHRLDRAHVVQPVGELDQDDPDVRGHRDDHLAVVLGLRLVVRLERDPGQLRDAVDEPGDLLAELSRTSSSDADVSSTVSCSSAAHSVSVSRRSPAQIFATPTGWLMKSSPDLRRWSACFSQANTNACSHHLAPVDGDRGVVGMLGDDREQIAEHPGLVRGQLRAGDRCRGLLVAVDPARAGTRIRALSASSAVPARPVAARNGGIGSVASSVRPPGVSVVSGIARRPGIAAGRRGTRATARARCAVRPGRRAPSRRGQG